MHTKNNSQKIFVDTSSFVSLEDNNDPNHTKAIKRASLLHEQKSQLYTSSDVIAETLTVISMKLGKKAAKIFYEGYITSGFTEIFVERDLHQEVRKFFLNVKSKNISFIDCSNVVIMKKHGIAEIFSFDKDFKKLGVKLFGEN